MLVEQLYLLAAVLDLLVVILLLAAVLLLLFLAYLGLLLKTLQETIDDI